MSHEAVIVDDRSRHAYRSGFWTPTKGVRLPAEHGDLTARCSAVRLIGPPGLTFSGETAVLLWDGVEACDDCIEFTIPGTAHPKRRSGIRARRRDLMITDVTEVKGFPVTTPARTFADVADRLALPSLVAVGDDFLRRGLCARPELAAALTRGEGQRGIRKARRALDLLDPTSESPRESITRAIIIEAGLPAPTPQVNIYDRFGRFIARGDLVYEEARVVIEYDGFHHLTLEGQRKDARRRGELGIEGWLIVTIVPADVHRPRDLVAKVSRALASRDGL
ncbi:MAG: hypothetical protein ACKOMX_01065 [Actinomycetota bacterium]